MVRLLASLVDSSGKILVDGVMNDVKPVTLEEEALYDSIDFDMEAYKEESKVQSVSDKLLHSDKKSLLMHRWRYPTLSLHGIEGAFHGPGAKTVIPSKVIGKFSLRLVPEQKPSQIELVVKKHIEAEFAKVGLVPGYRCIGWRCLVFLTLFSLGFPLLSSWDLLIKCQSRCRMEQKRGFLHQSTLTSWRQQKLRRLCMA